MARPRKYTDTQIAAIVAMGALQPRPSLMEIARITGMPFDTVRYHIEGRSKTDIMQPWAEHVMLALRAMFHRKRVLAAYYLVASAKILMQGQK